MEEEVIAEGVNSGHSGEAAIRQVETGAERFEQGVVIPKILWRERTQVYARLRIVPQSSWEVGAAGRHALP